MVQEDLGQPVDLGALRVKATPAAAMPPVGARPKERKDKKQKKDKKAKGSKASASMANTPLCMQSDHWHELMVVIWWLV